VHILASVESNNLVTGTKNINGVGSSTEYPENSMPGHQPGEAYQSVEPERRKDHQTISTAAYYLADQHEFGYGSEEAQDEEMDGETGDA
jgi:hypothetical protein